MRGPELADALARESARWATQARELHVPGFTVEVVDHTGVLFRFSSGRRDCAMTHAPDAATIYYIASATKPFVAAAVVRLAEQGKIDLDAPVRRYLPRFALAEAESAARVSIRDLLSHRQGLDSVPIEIAEAFTGEIDDDKFYRLLRQVHARGAFRYSNLHYTLLGRVIEAVTGTPWPDYLRRAIFDPAGMQRTVTSAVALRRRSRRGVCTRGGRERLATGIDRATRPLACMRLRTPATGPWIFALLARRRAKAL